MYEKEKNNVVTFPIKENEHNKIRCSSYKPDIDLIIRDLINEIRKLDVLHDIASEITLNSMRNEIGKRADALKVISFNLRCLQ